MPNDKQGGRVTALEPEQAAWVHALVERTDDLLLVLDHGARVRYVNPKVEHFTKTSREELLGRDLFTLPVPGLDGPLATEIRACLAERRPGMITFGDKTTQTWWDAELIPVPGGLSMRACDISTWQDKVIRLEQQNHALRHAQQESVAVARAKASWLGRMNHELLTPLNAILGFAELLADDPEGRLSDEQADCVRQIRKAGRALLKLTEDSLDLARSERGEIRLREEIVEVGATVEETCLLLAPYADRMKVTINAYCDDRTPIVRGDSTRLRQIVTNLIANAVKYSKPEGGRVQVSVLPRNPLGITIRVADNGVGIAESQQRAIFEPFERGEQESGDKEGHGIGLAVTRRLVDLMGGEIEVNSAPGNGAAFTVALPLPSIDPCEPEECCT